MSKAKAKKSAVKAVRKSDIKPVPAIIAAGKKLKAAGAGPCDIVRGVVKQFKKARRVEIERSLVSGLRMNLGTVRRQIQVALS